jgi:hypothetical protein
MGIFLWRNKKIGFSLVELLLVVSFIVTMTVVVLRNKKQNRLSHFELMKQIEEVTLLSFFEAIESGNEYKITLFFEEGVLLTHISYEAKEKKNQNKNNFIKKKLTTPFYIHHCFVNGIDEMKNQSKEVWFFVFPKGVCQEVTLVISKTKDDAHYNYVLNPLRGTFEDIPNFK